MLDAYTVRKAIPRIVVAVIGINLSIYLCIAMIDITSVVGGGIAQLLSSPFNAANIDYFDIKTDPTNFIVGGVGLFLAAGPLIGAVGAFVGSVAGAGGIVAGAGVISQGLVALFFLLIPVILLVLAILGVVILRQALLLFLTIVSPVAIALFVLPGTEKYFKKWFDTFVKTLMVYPIIAITFAMSDIFASIIFSNNNGGITGVAQLVTGIIVIFAPLFLIPFAFRLAGGAIAGLMKVAGGMGDRIGKSGFIKGRQEYYGQRFGDTQLRARAEAFRRAKASEEGAVGDGLRARMTRSTARRRQRAYAGYKEDIYQREAAMTERIAKEQEAQKNFGDDTDRRAYGIDLDAARADMAAGSTVQTIDGQQYRVSQNGLMRQRLDANGNVEREQFVSLGGSWQSEAAVRQSERRFGKRNLGQLQSTLNYEMTKAIEEGQQEQLIQRYGSLSQSWGMSDSERQGTWIGPAFNNQNEDLMYKHTSFDGATGAPTTNYAGMTREVYEKKGPQMLAYLKGKNVKTMREAHVDAVRRLNNSVVGSAEHTQAQTELAMHESIADTLASQQATLPSGAGAPAAPGAPAGAPAPTVPPAAGGGPAAGKQYGWTTGSGHTTDELKKYFAEVQEVSQERAGPGGMAARTRNDTYIDPATGGDPANPESQAAENDPNRPIPR